MFTASIERSGLSATLRHRRRLVLAVGASLFLSLLWLSHHHLGRTFVGLFPDGWKSQRHGHVYEDFGNDGQGGRGALSRVIAGCDGFYVFENVYVKDRKLCESSAASHRGDGAVS
jgi:hypothetical protein